MPTASEILEKKGHDVVSVLPTTTVLEAVRRMNERGIGAVVVATPAEGVVGIFTERDLVRRVVAEGKTPETTPVKDVMTCPIACCRPDTTLAECQSVMTSKRIRHLPVVKGGELVGLISSGDILAREVQVQQTTIEYLHEYLHGRR